MFPRRALAAAALAAALIAPLLFVRVAFARTSADLPWSYDPLWPVVLRYVRIDLGAEIKDKDRDGGYVVFELKPDDGNTYECHLELARVRDFAGRAAVRVTLDLGGYPREAYVLRGIEEKARGELGEPPDPTPMDAGAPAKSGDVGASRRPY